MRREFLKLINPNTDRTPKSLICGLCLEVADSPEETECCNKLFCKTCISQISDEKCFGC